MFGRKIYQIVLVNRSMKDFNNEVKFILGVVGEENIMLTDQENIKREKYNEDDYHSVWIGIRASDEEWEQIRFHLNLEQVWA